ncbi:E3 ubiquitin-protein ligase HAKAI homolog [Curcuma longa]|uniref:E3 ubiquitin-protein ligase HAKAI homolog n=1 Tax=Curcuma longa TaxID=136217 RepID=UPI003D9F5463
MLQIRLSKGPSADCGGGPAAKALPTFDTVTVACPDHLVIADLPVAKSVGAVTSSAAVVRTVGRRSRRSLGDRVHFCVRCDFPIAIYGRLAPCEHAFCLTCARSDASCYLCDERIQKIQSIKMMEGIFICAAPHCFKSFIKQADFVTHIHEIHSDLIQSNTKKEDGSEKEARASSTDTHKQSMLQETSTARAPPKPGFSSSTNLQPHDRDELAQHHQSADYSSSMMPAPPTSMLFENNLPQGSDKSNAWMNQPQGYMTQAGSQSQQVSDQSLADKHALNPLQPPMPPNYQLPVNLNQAMIPPTAFSYPVSVDGSQQYYSVPYETFRPEQLQAGGPAQGSVLGFSPGPTGIATFAGNAQRPWVTGQMVVPLDPSLMLTQGSLQGFVNVTDAHGNNQISGGWLLNQPHIGQDSKFQGVSSVNNDSSKGIFAQLQQPGSLQMPLPPPPPLPLQMPQQLNMGNFSGFSSVNQESQGYG